MDEVVRKCYNVEFVLLKRVLYTTTIMNIAVVFYGQPRDYRKGYNTIKKFIETQQDCTFNFFYHCWILDENQTYNHSPWRKIVKTELCYTKNTVSDLQELYNPISYEIENQNNVTFEDSLYKNTIAFNNTKGKKLANINNTLFQMYSRNKARNLLDIYLEKMSNKVQYDFVLTLRFDISVMPNVQFHELNRSKVYVSNIHFPRKILPDNCIIAPTYIFLEWFTIYDKLKDIINNTGLLKNVIKLNETIDINPEELLFAKYIFHYRNTDNIVYIQGGTI